jgi:HAD superfamily hydrolase (TIGR01490 family)
VTSTLALFDLDHTLLSGDSDVLWCEWLMTQGLLERATFEPRNAAMEAGYKAGTVSVAEFCGFYVGTLAGRTLEQWHPMRQRFLVEEIAPRIPPAARDQVRHHQDAGHTVVLTTATNRVITELTAQHLDIEHLIATDCEVGADGCFTGRVAGTPNMREGKVARLQTWLAERGTRLDALDSIAYSDSMNDAPLLSAARRAVAVDPDPRLAALARDRGWKVLRWR